MTNSEVSIRLAVMEEHQRALLGELVALEVSICRDRDRREIDELLRGEDLMSAAAEVIGNVSRVFRAKSEVSDDRDFGIRRTERSGIVDGSHRT